MAGEITLSGKDYVTYVDTTTPITAPAGAAYEMLLCEVSSDFSISTDEQTVSNKCGGGWTNSNPNNSSWSYSGEWQAIDPATAAPSSVSLDVIAGLAANRTKFWVKRALVDNTTNTVQILREGVVWINDYTETAGTDDPYTFSADMVGVGQPILGETT